MRYSREFIDKVISASQLADLVSQYTVLKPAGKSLVGRCPFPDHKEKTPSFHVSPDKQVYHCFGCKKGGNVFTFLQHFQGMNFPEAIEHLALRAHIPLPEKQASETVQRESTNKKELLEVNRLAAQYFIESYARLPSDHPVKEYTHKRYLKTESIERFQIGYAPDEWEGFVRYLRGQGLSASLAEDLGLLKQRESGGYYDLFRDRLMFSITNPVGEVVGFGGRAIGEGLPKYLNSPESNLFHKGRSLYGLQHSGRYIRSQDYAIIVEGYMDLIALYQAGFQNVVAPLGTALTLDQCRILARMTKNVIVLFDGDAAGQSAAERSLPLLFEAGLYPKALVLPEEQDPDEFVLAQGAEGMARELSLSQDLFSLILRRWMQGYQGGATDKVRLVQKLKPLFDSLRDTSLKSLYLREVAQRLSVDLKWMHRAISSSGAIGPNPYGATRLTPSAVPRSVSVDGSQGASHLAEGGASTKGPSDAEKNEQVLTEEPKIDLQGAPKWELYILLMALNSEGPLWDRILHSEERGQLSHAGVKKVLDRVETLAGQSGLPSVNLFVLMTNEILNPDLLTALIKELPSGDHEGEARLLTDCFRKVRIFDLDRKIKALAQDLKLNSTQDKWEQLANLQRDRLRCLNLNF